MRGTIKSKDEMERLFREGRRSSSYMLSVLVLPSPRPQGRCAFVAGKKLGPAPVRNRCKRVMREVARELGSPWEGHDVVFVARRKVATARHEKVCAEARRQLSKVGVLEGA